MTLKKIASYGIMGAPAVVVDGGTALGTSAALGTSVIFGLDDLNGTCY